LVPSILGIRTFVNADVIAQGLSGFDPESHAVEAGRYMLAQLKRLAAERESFAFETTLASRSFAPWIDKLVDAGYEFSLIFVALPHADAAIDRVRQRVARGGHHVPNDVVRRRFERGRRNFLRLYQPRASYWQVYNGVTPGLMAEGSYDSVLSVADPIAWQQFQREENS
jgi:predicted ABC-type ATPase